MADFAHVEFDADKGTDKIIQKLFQSVSSKKKKKVRSKPVKSCDDVVMKNDVTVCGSSHKEQNHLRRKKSMDNDLAVTSAEKDKIFQNPKSNEHIPRRIRKNKYYSLLQSQQNSKCGAVVEESVKVADSTKTKIKLNKQTRKKKIVSESVFLSEDSSKVKSLHRRCPTTFQTDQEDEVLPVLQATNLPDSREDNCFSKRSSSEKAKRKLDLIKVTDHSTDISAKKQKRKVSMQDGVLLETKQSKLKHEKTTKISAFAVPELREVSIENKSDQNIKSTSLLERTTSDRKMIKTCNKGLKSLKDRMQEQLKAAQFRYLNEQLYSGSGASAYELFKNDKDSFRIYHEGFQSQVLKWPNNPLDRIIHYIRKSPSSHVVADFGCGGGRLAENVPQKVHSFDLVSLKPHVIACDMAHVPLKTGSVDICVFCLSLMGTNLLDYLLEAHRVLKMEGILLIAEVISRFENVASFIRKLEKLGFILINENITSKMFIFFELKKKFGYDKTLLPQITLEPCVYKKR